MPVTDAQIIDLGLADREKWFINEVFPQFKDAPFETRRLLIDRLQHLRRLPKELEERRRPLRNMLAHYHGQDKAQAIAELKTLTRLIAGFARVKGRRNPNAVKMKPPRSADGKPRPPLKHKQGAGRNSYPVQTGLHRELMILRERHYLSYRKHHPERFKDFRARHSNFQDLFDDDVDEYEEELEPSPGVESVRMPAGPEKYVYMRWLPDHREPYPDYTDALISIMQMVHALIEIDQVLENIPEAANWKSRIQATLNHAELKPIVESNEALELINRFPNPYLFCTKDALGSLFQAHRKKWGDRSEDVDLINWRNPEIDSLSYPDRGEQQRSLMQARKIQEELVSEGKFLEIQKQMLALRDRYATLWELTDARQYKDAFARQFGDNLMPGPLAELDYYARLTIRALQNDEVFAEPAEGIGTIELRNFYSPIIGIASRKEKPKMGGMLGSLFNDIEEFLRRAHEPTVPEAQHYGKPISVRLGEDQHSLLESGLNMGGKTVLARTIGLAVQLNQAGLTLPVEYARLSQFRNIYTVFPRPEQFQPGYGYFESLLSQLKEVQTLAGPGDLIILDEVPTGTDYKELVAVATVILEDLINSGATVVATGHLKKCFTLLQERTGQQPYRQSVREVDGRIVPTYELEPGVAKHSYAIELMADAGFPADVIEKARAYYRVITEGADVTTIPKATPQIRPTRAHGNHPTYSEEEKLVDTVIHRLYPTDNFVSEDTAKRVYRVLQHRDHLANDLEKLQSDLVDGDKQVGTKAHMADEAMERLRLTGVFVSQGRRFLTILRDRLAAFNARQDDGVASQLRQIESILSLHKAPKPSFDPQVNLKALQAMEQNLGALLYALKPIEAEPVVGLILRALEKQIDQIAIVRERWTNPDSEEFQSELAEAISQTEESAEKKSKAENESGMASLQREIEATIQPRQIDPDAPLRPHQDWRGASAGAKNELQRRWQRDYKILQSGLAMHTQLLDEFNGIATSVLQYQMKPAILVDAPRIFAMKEAMPFRSEVSEIDLIGSSFRSYFGSRFANLSGPYIENGIRQSIVIDPAKPILVITGTNSSGKTVSMLTARINALLALNGFYTSGDLTISRFDNIGTFFGGQNISETGESYFMNNLGQYASILRHATPHSLVILDELHGSDSFETAAIQLAMNHVLREKGATVIFNTHIRDGLKAAAEKIGLDFAKTDVEFDEAKQEVKPHYTISPDPNLEAKSYGLPIARKWLTEDQYKRAQAILNQLEKEESAAAPAIPHHQEQFGGAA